MAKELREINKNHVLTLERAC